MQTRQWRRRPRSRSNNQRIILDLAIPTAIHLEMHQTLRPINRRDLGMVKCHAIGAILLEPLLDWREDVFVRHCFAVDEGARRGRLVVEVGGGIDEDDAVERAGGAFEGGQDVADEVMRGALAGPGGA